MSLFGENNMGPMCSMNDIKKKHQPSVLFRTSYGVVSLIDPDSIKRFQMKSGCMIDGKLGPQTKAAIMRSLLDPSDIGALDKAIPIRARRGSEISFSPSTKDAEDLVEHLIRESGSF